MNEQIIKYFQGELNTTERLQFLRQVETNSELKKQFIEYKNMHALLTLSDQSDNKEENRQGYILFNKIIRTKKIRKIILHTASYAAAITLLVLSTYWFTTSHYDIQQSVADIENTLYVPAGQRVEMKVLGTKFNVHSYPGKETIQTSLLEGGLKVYFPHAESKGVILKPDEQVTIKGNQMKIGSLPHADYFLWRDGIYSFINEPLIDILKKLELYYDVKIIVKDQSIYNWEYTGKFRQRDGIDQILHMIQKIHKFKIRKDEEKNIFTLSR